ncbi:uncharacterized protein TNCV_3283271 [Trichonephila clavipes]|nr:uncharacterized protein TNCV_3283271 [Trichonephila clavipes]
MEDGDRFNSCQVIYSQFGLAIHQNDHQARRRFVEWAQNEIAVVPDFHKRILFSDEAHFWLNGYVNKQNCRIWSDANPQVYVKTPLLRSSVVQLISGRMLLYQSTLKSSQLLDSIKFNNSSKTSVRLNNKFNGIWSASALGHVHKISGVKQSMFLQAAPSILREVLPTDTSRKTDCLELWFQQDGATCHTARATIDLLKDTFGDRLISRFEPVNWPPRSCDLTPLDYFLRGYVKSLVYADKPQTFDHLEDNIRRVIADILPQMLEKVIENWTSRLDYIRACRGSHMPEIIFKM